MSLLKYFITLMFALLLLSACTTLEWNREQILRSRPLPEKDHMLLRPRLRMLTLWPPLWRA
jgi:hypothetical protein